MTTRTKYRKRPEVESVLGMTIEDYIRDASERGISQGQMAKECKVMPSTIAQWIEDERFEQVRKYGYVRPDEAAA